jgi:CubicO group peptidase (beta-lactamase class C family)
MARMSSGVLLAGEASMACPGPDGGRAPWPTADWARSTPEEQGMDSARLAAMLDTINDNGIYIDGMVVIRNGYLVLEGYRHPFEADSLHTIMSCTKSVISALVGIAIAQGSLRGPDQRVAEFFPDWDISVPDHAKRDVTIGNLLTMSGGFEWPGGMRETAAQEMVRSPNWVRFALDRPLRDVPGRTFVYDSGGSHLLSAIVQHATGMPAQSFAKTHLFSSLGITDWSWDSDPQGITQGFMGLALRLRDMAKFGYLYLNHGLWENRQVVPATWVSDSVRKQIDAGSMWMSDGYGYQWWVDNGGLELPRFGGHV